ncbi:MAG: hypothetical protein C4532_01405 [Candidatus Abyssobacteria bacterium SURF_17]|uniref:Uncharacterized protein n=1 Tax=Candidatus Abyssobacteria bacterium SURF_17 TaxID=2093361 RepID=A0A419F8V0_9BACT|nr:MAG: hypothetical protein C4532_01405 [Candidatus Abyssubacteria bacterium SURF_17]
MLFKIVFSTAEARRAQRRGEGVGMEKNVRIGRLALCSFRMAICGAAVFFLVIGIYMFGLYAPGGDSEGSPWGMIVRSLTASVPVIAIVGMVLGLTALLPGSKSQGSVCREEDEYAIAGFIFNLMLGVAFLFFFILCLTPTY